jgi:hypothetical protein
VYGIPTLAQLPVVPFDFDKSLGKLAVPCGSDASDFIRPPHQLSVSDDIDIETSGNMVSATVCVACFISDLEYARRCGITITLAMIVLTLTRVV